MSKAIYTDFLDMCLGHLNVNHKKNDLGPLNYTYTFLQNLEIHHSTQRTNGDVEEEIVEAMKWKIWFQL